MTARSDHAFLTESEHFAAMGAEEDDTPPGDERHALFTGIDLGERLPTVGTRWGEIGAFHDGEGSLGHFNPSIGNAPIVGDDGGVAPGSDGQLRRRGSKPGPPVARLPPLPKR